MSAVMQVPALQAGVLALLAAGAIAALDHKKVAPRRASLSVVFVCEHGNVKSLVASQWFNRLAAERGVAAHAVPRGVRPETPVPASLTDHLREDGFDVRRFEARALTPADVDHAARVVMIGIDAPAWVGRGGVPVDKWDGIPPASERYEASRDAMRERIALLLDTLASRGPVR
jgi:arsenate reductase